MGKKSLLRKTMSIPRVHYPTELLKTRSTSICRHILILITALTLFIFLLHQQLRSFNVKTVGTSLRRSATSDDSSDCRISFGTYNGPKYLSEKFTRGNPKCLVQSKWMRLMQHSVQLTKSSPVIEDWLWIDYHERVNVLVEAPTVTGAPSQERQWLIFKQFKYALEDASTLAIIGGIIEHGETPMEAASREIQEELQVTCQSSTFLGRFRTDVNRGMGYTNSFVMMDCSYIRSGSEEQNGAKKEEVGESDQEQQDVIRMSTSQVKDAVRQGKFMEVQWSNTVALALMHTDAVTLNSKL
jgi:8-oxo-dGTP pyrophosphatase MutT (NUDIX family)